MSFFKRLFGGGKKDEINTIPISELNNKDIPDDVVIVHQSELPESLELGNLNFNKEYEESIRVGKKLLKKNPHDAGAHINIMVAYFKLRNENEEYFDLSTHHAKQAIICGHNTGYAHERLVINLTKKGMIHQAIQLCDLVLSNSYSFSSHGCGNTHDYNKRRQSLLNRVERSKDSENDILFTEKEIAGMIKHIEDDKKREAKERKEHAEKMAKLKASILKDAKYFKRGF